MRFSASLGGVPVHPSLTRAIALTSVDHAVGDLAGGQHGVVSRRQLLAHGLTEEMIDGRLRRGLLLRIHPGVYAVGHAALSPDGRRMAAVLAGGPDALLSHVSAAVLWGLLQDRGATQFHVLSPIMGHGRAGPGGVRMHTTRRLAEADTAVVRGIPVTSVPRTLVDVAATMSHQVLARAVHEAEVLRMLDVSTVLAAIQPGRRGGGRLRALLASPEDPGDDNFAASFAALCRRHRLPSPGLNVHVDVGTKLYEVDALFADQRVAVELDGEAVHRTRKNFESDRRRDFEMAAAGYLTVRLTWRRLRRERPAVAAELRRILEVRAITRLGDG